MATFYSAVICSLIVFSSVCLGGNISRFDRGRLEKIVKEKDNNNNNKTGHVLGKPLDNFKILYEKQTVQKTNGNIKRSHTPNEIIL